MKLAISLVPVFPNQKTQQNKNFKQSKENALRTWNLGLLIDTLVSCKIFCSDLDVKSTKVTSRNDQWCLKYWKSKVDLRCKIRSFSTSQRKLQSEPPD